MLATFILAFNIVAFASSGSNDLDSSDIDSFDTCWSEYISKADYNVENYNYLYRRGAFSGRENAMDIYLVSKNDVLIYNGTTYDGLGRIYKIGYYDESTQTIKYGYSPYEAFIEPGYTSVYTHSNTELVYAYSTDFDYGTNVPMCASEEYALLYFTTMDYQYLENAEQFVDVPAPEDVGLYEASEENNLYLYWENSLGFSSDYEEVADYTKRTYIEWGYFYYNSSGELVQFSDTYSIDWLYCRRGQQAISLEALEQYETGVVVGHLYNYFSVGGYSANVMFSYQKENGVSQITYYDEDGNILVAREYNTSDYGVKNEAFTGGLTPISTIAEASDGEYGFLSYIVNAFNLAGNNGVIALIGSCFSFIPQPILYILYGFVAVAVLVALFKLVLR